MAGGQQDLGPFLSGEIHRKELINYLDTICSSETGAFFSEADSQTYLSVLQRKRQMCRGVIRVTFGLICVQIQN